SGSPCGNGVCERGGPRSDRRARRVSAIANRGLFLRHRCRAFCGEFRGERAKVFELGLVCGGKAQRTGVELGRDTKQSKASGIAPYTSETRALFGSTKTSCRDPVVVRGGGNGAERACRVEPLGGVGGRESALDDASIQKWRSDSLRG